MKNPHELAQIRVWQDQDAEDPTTFGLLKLISFSSRHASFAHPDTLDMDDIQEKVNDRFAWWLDCYQHGCCIWSLHGSGTQCRWDTARKGGVLVPAGDSEMEELKAMTPDERERLADSVLRVYNMWLAGETYGWTQVAASDGEFLDSVGGFYGHEDLFSSLMDRFGDHGFTVQTSWQETHTHKDDVCEYFSVFVDSERKKREKEAEPKR